MSLCLSLVQYMAVSIFCHSHMSFTCRALRRRALARLPYIRISLIVTKSTTKETKTVKNFIPSGNNQSYQIEICQFY